MFTVIRYFMISTSITLIMFGIVFLFLSRQNKNRYMIFWGLAMISYASMFILDFYNIENVLNYNTYLAQRLIFSCCSSLLLLAGTFHFFKKKITSDFWILACTSFTLLTCCLISPYVFNGFVLIVILLTSFILIRAGLLFTIHNYPQRMPEQYGLSLIIILWSIYSNNFPFTKDYLSLAVINYYISLLLLNALAILFIVVHFKKSSFAIEKQEAHYRMLVENASGLILLYNYGQEQFEYISPAIKTLFGYSPKELYENPMLILEDTNEEDYVKLNNLFANPLKTPSSFIFKLQGKRNGARWYEIHSSPFFDNKGVTEGIECIISDITARMEAEQSLKKSEKARKDLVEDISHELRTPITLIQGYSESLIHELTPPTSYKTYLEIIHSNVLTLNALLEDLIQASNFTSQSIEYKYYEVSATSFFNKMLVEVQFHIEKDNKTGVCKNYISEGYYVVADEYRIEQVFTNLINNALKFSQDGDPIRVTCHFESHLSKEDLDSYRSEKDEKSSFRPPSGKIHVEVKDLGIGINPKDMPHIFKRKYIGINQSTKKGFGIGLYISKEIIKQHGGQIWAENNPEGGASFHFTIPSYVKKIVAPPSSD